MVQPAWAHINDAVFVNRPAIAAAWLARTPTVCHVRSLGRLGASDRLWGATVRRFVFISRRVADDAARQGLPAARGRLIYDGLDASDYAALPDRVAACASLGLDTNRPIVAVVGRLVSWKGQDLFLRAMRQVVDAMPEAQGLIAGAVESFSRAFGDELQALRRDLGLEAAVRFTGHITDVARVRTPPAILWRTPPSRRSRSAWR